MLTSASGLMTLLAAIDAVKDNQRLSGHEKEEILSEMLFEIPDPRLCRLSLKTREIVVNKLEEAIYGAKTKTESAAQNRSEATTKGSEEELLQGISQNPRGKGANARVGQNKKEKPRSTSRRS